MNLVADPTAWVLWGGLVLGFVFGAVAARTNFCTMGALSDVVNIGHWGRLRMWLLAVAVAVVGANLLQLGGWVDLSKSIYLRPTLPWLSLLFGGTLFGIGMTLSGGCVNKNLVRLGGGSVRSLVVLVFVAIAAYMSLKGLFGQWRAGWLDPVAIDVAAFGLADPGLPSLVGRLGGLAPRAAVLFAGGTVAVLLLGVVLIEARFRRNAVQVLGAVALGLVVVAGWALSGHIGHGENPETLETVYFATNTRTLESLSFVAPVAYGLELLMLWTDRSLHLSFGIVTAIGVVAGALAHALASRSFRWEGFASLQDLSKQLVGAVLMGFGGVTAMGCTVGQGLSGLSTLSIGSLIAVSGIVGGAVATLKVIAWRDD